MCDREKVIDGMMRHKKDGDCGIDCPYWDLDNCSEQLYDDVLALLREQEPVKPQKMLDGSWSYERCGACGKVLYERGFAYCPWCGRKVKWNE